jgi:hypothetical protein
LSKIKKEMFSYIVMGERGGERYACEAWSENQEERAH